MDQLAEFAAGTANEHRVRVGPAGQAGGRPPLDQRVVADAQAGGIGARNGGIGGVLLDRPDVAVRRQSRAFEADRAGAGADVPDGRRCRQAQLGE